MTDGDSKDGDCDEVICTGGGKPQKESEQIEVDGMKKRADFRGKMMHI